MYWGTVNGGGPGWVPQSLPLKKFDTFVPLHLLPLASPGRWTPSRPHKGSHSTLLKQMASLNNASLVIAGLLSLILVFLMIFLVFLYFQKQISKIKLRLVNMLRPWPSK